MSITRENLILLAQDLYGDRWRRKLARALGPLHPQGARETIDPRLPARWATGERDIPDWVGPAIKGLALARYEALRAGAIRSGLIEE